MRGDRFVLLRSRRSRVNIALALALALIVVATLALAPAVLLVRRDAVPGERGYYAALVALVSRVLGGDAKNPLKDEAKGLVAGRAAFTGSCAQCHGANGDGRGVLGSRTFPDAFDLRSEAARAMSDAQLFWIVKNGLGFTAMPSFKVLYEDDEIWAIVLYLRRLQREAAGILPVPPPTAAQLQFADPRGTAQQRGAAVYFAMNCHQCHAGAGNGPGDLDIRGRIDSEVVRTPQPGMPHYDTRLVTNEELDNLVAYMLTFPPAR